MKVQINAEMLGQELIEMFSFKLGESSIKAGFENIKIQVFSEKTDKWLEFKPENVKLTYFNEV